MTDTIQARADHDWENLPIANRVVSIGPNVVDAERRRLIEVLQTR